MGEAKERFSKAVGNLSMERLSYDPLDGMKEVRRMNSEISGIIEKITNALLSTQHKFNSCNSKTFEGLILNRPIEKYAVLEKR